MGEHCLDGGKKIMPEKSNNSNQPWIKSSSTDDALLILSEDVYAPAAFRFYSDFRVFLTQEFFA